MNYGFRVTLPFLSAFFMLLFPAFLLALGDSSEFDGSLERLEFHNVIETLRDEELLLKQKSMDRESTIVEREKKLQEMKKANKKKLLQVKEVNLSPSLTGMTGGIDLPNAWTIDEGQFVLSSHFLRRRESNTSPVSTKISYGLYKNFEVGIALGELEAFNAKTHAFSFKYTFPKIKNITWAAAIQTLYVENPGMSNNAVNLWGIMNVDFVPFIDANVAFLWSNAPAEPSLTISFLAEIMVVSTPIGTTSLILEIEEDPYTSGYKQYNFGLRHRMSDIFNLDIVRRQTANTYTNPSASDDSSGIGITLKF